MHLNNRTSSYLVLISTPSHNILCFYCMGMATMKSWDDCQDLWLRVCHFSFSNRQRERERVFVDPLISSMDLVLSVNTTYLACIVVVLLFVIYKWSVNPKMWFLPRHHFVWFQLHRGLRVALFSSQGSLVSHQCLIWSGRHCGTSDTLMELAFLLWVWIELTDLVWATFLTQTRRAQ